ncbi:hypothetical protein MCOR20_010289 [Pyricularia oryzae]|nr:hypothetical protein MCOR20_010289 [Pyricularia oryzae]
MSTAVEQHDPHPDYGCGVIATTSAEPVLNHSEHDAAKYLTSTPPRIIGELVRLPPRGDQLRTRPVETARPAEENAKPEDGYTPAESRWESVGSSYGARPSLPITTSADLWPRPPWPSPLRTRRYRSKALSGCMNCKLRRIKCDEKRPECTQCTRSKKTCVGYPPPPHCDRPFEEVPVAPRPDEIRPPKEEQPLALPSYVSKEGHGKIMAEKYDFYEDLDIVDPDGHEALHKGLRLRILRSSELAIGMESLQHLPLGPVVEASEPGRWSPYVKNPIRNTESGYSRALENSANMECILQQFDYLRDHGFASDFLSILVARPGAVVEIVPIYRASLVDIIDAIKALKQLMEAPYDHLDSIAKIHFGRLQSILQRALDRISAKLGSAFENRSQLHPEWPSRLATMADCQWLVRILDLALVSYSGSHAIRFDKELITEVLTGVKMSPGIIEVPASDMYCSAQLSLQRLACLDGLLDRQVWVLSSKLDPCEANRALSVLTTISLFADLWGPVYTVRHPDDNAKILQHNAGKGVIRRQDNDKVPAQMARCLLEYDEAVVPCHWESAPKHFLSRCVGGVRRLLKPPKSFLRDGDLLLIGAAEPAPEAKSGLHPNKGCQYTSDAFFADSNDMLGVPGTRPAKWVKDGLEVGAGLELSMLSFSVTGKAKKIPGTTLKQRILTRWTQAPARANPWILNHLLAVEVSQCTGNARRIALRDLLFRDELKEYLDVQMPSWASTDWGTALLQAIQSSDAEELLRFWKTHQYSRENVGQLIASILELLDDTGNDGISFRAALVHQNMEHLIKLPLDKNSWASVLGDSDISATYALVTKVCLSPKYDLNGQNSYTRCSQDDAGSNKAYTCLQTMLVLPNDVKKHIRIRGDREENAYSLTENVLMKASDLRSTAESLLRKVTGFSMYSEAKDSMDRNAVEVTLKSRRCSYGGMSKPRTKVPCQQLGLSAIDATCRISTNEQPTSILLPGSSAQESKRSRMTLQQRQSWAFPTITDSNCPGDRGPPMLPSHPVAHVLNTPTTIEGTRVNLTAWVPAKEVVEIMAGDSSQRH